MDVTLILRGPSGEMDEAIVQRAVGLLFADGAEAARLCFAGELALDRMRLATALARREAAGRPLELAVSTVVAPETAPFLFRRVRRLWDDGVAPVDVDLDPGSRWTLADREVLREELIAIGREALSRRLRGREAGLVQLDAARAHPAGRQIVVGVDGRLFACAQLEEPRCVGHLDAGAAAAVACAPPACDRGERCACRLSLETDDLRSSVAIGPWFRRIGREVGAAVVAGLGESQRRRPMDRLNPRALFRLHRPLALFVGAAIALASLTLVLAGALVFEELAPTPQKLKPRPHTAEPTRHVRRDLVQPPPPPPAPSAPICPLAAPR